MLFFSNLGEGFWGALFGALIAGIISVWISKSEYRQRKKENEAEIKKVLLNFWFIVNKAGQIFIEIKNNKNALKAISNPFDEVEEIEEDGYIYHANMPPNEVIEEYDRETIPFKNKISILAINLFEQIELLNLVDINNVDLKNFKEILIFKNKINELLGHSLRTKDIDLLLFNDEKTKNLENIITVFNEKIKAEILK